MGDKLVCCPLLNIRGDMFPSSAGSPPMITSYSADGKLVAFSGNSCWRRNKTQNDCRKLLTSGVDLKFLAEFFSDVGYRMFFLNGGRRGIESEAYVRHCCACGAYGAAWLVGCGGQFAVVSLWSSPPSRPPRRRLCLLAASLRRLTDRKEKCVVYARARWADGERKRQRRTLGTSIRI